MPSDKPVPKYRPAQIIIGKNLLRLRIAAMHTQESLAIEIGCSPTAIAAVESGMGHIPADKMASFAVAFGISLMELIVELGATAVDVSHTNAPDAALAYRLGHEAGFRSAQFQAAALIQKAAKDRNRSDVNASRTAAAILDMKESNNAES